MLHPLDWSRRIEEALERDLFVLRGQRIVDVANGETMRHELFLRLVDRHRLIPAGEVAMVAEEFGSIREIDRWVVARAIEVAASGIPWTPSSTPPRRSAAGSRSTDSSRVAPSHSSSGASRSRT